MTSEKQEYAVWCGLIPDYIITPLQATLPTDIKMLGRVERLIKENNPWKIVDLANFNQAAQAEKFIEILNTFNVIFKRKAFSKDDFEVQYPDMIVSPIAIYR